MRSSPDKKENLEEVLTPTKTGSNAKPRPTSTYAEVTARNKQALLPQFQAYRLTISFPIEKPPSKAKRMSAICKALNKFLIIAKSVSYKSRTVYIRKFKDHHSPKDTDKPDWIKEFDKTKIAHLVNYTHGFYPYQALQKRVFRLRLQAMIPIQDDPKELIMNTHELFSKSEDWRVQDLDAQNLHDPTDVGWLFRSSWRMTSSTELKDSIQEKANKSKKAFALSLTSKTISPPGNYIYDKETAVNAVMVSCNAEDFQIATDFLFNQYNKGNSAPLGIQMKFIPTRDNPEVKNNAVALQNLSVLIDRQRVFKTKTQFAVCQQLAFPDETLADGKTLREKLMALSPTTTSDEHKEAKLFHAIIRQGNSNGTPQYSFIFHEVFALEANSIVANMGVFLRDELALDPEAYCYPSLINPTHKWDPQTRTCITCTGTFMTDLVGETADLCIEDTPNEIEEEVEMTSKDGREFRRMVGLDDTETVMDMHKKRQPKAKVPTQVTNDDRSVRSELSGLTNYSSSTKASLQRKELRATVETQQDAIADKEKEIERLRAALLEINNQKDTTANKAITSGSKVPEDNHPEEGDDISYSDSNADDQTSEREMAVYPTVVLQGSYDVHNCIMYPRNKYVQEDYLDEDLRYPVHSSNSVDDQHIDPHWDYIGEYVKEVAGYIMEQEDKKNRIIQASKTGTLDPNKIAVYVWSVQDTYYTANPEGDNPYPPSEDIKHVMDKSEFIRNPVYPPITEADNQMEYLSEEVPIHNPQALLDMELHDQGRRQ